MSGLKKNTIKLVLENVVKNWLASITDEEVRKLAAANTIVTGGSIANLLMGEKVNDYDLYFRNRETTEAVAKYYANKFNSDTTLKSKVRGYAPEVRSAEIINIRGEKENRIVFFMRSAGIADAEQDATAYDYFEMRPELEADAFLSTPDDPVEVAKQVKEDLKSKKEYRPLFLTDNAVTLSDRVQIIIRFWGEPAQLHTTFDFAHAMCWYDYGRKTLSIPAEAMECLLSKTLIYKGSLYPIASIFRVRKFIRRGWRISAGQLLKIIFQLQDVNLKDINILKEQLIGVDVTYMRQLISELSNNNGERVDATYIAKLVDKIFEDEE